MVVIAIGKHAHTLLGERPSGDRLIPNTLEGVRAVLGESEGEITFVGNRRWALAFASALKSEEASLRISFRKVAIEHGARGKLGSIPSVARHLRDEGLLDPMPFFSVKKAPTPLAELHKEALHYLEVTNEVRRVKHYLLDGLYVLFPEVVPQKSGAKAGDEFTAIKVSDIFDTKRMYPVLSDPRPEIVARSTEVPENVRLLAKDSIGRFVSREEREENFHTYREHLARYEELLSEKTGLMDDLRSQVRGGPLVRRFGDGDVLVILAALIGDEIHSDWRKLRAFAGLALTRQEASGKKRISRRNGAIRQYLYLYSSLTKEGKEMAKEIREAADQRAIEAGKEGASHKRVKVLEGVLKRMRREVKALTESYEYEVRLKKAV